MVYVDDMKATYGRMIMCHMIADSDIELHQMADCLGINRKWFQKNHYDVSLLKKEMAIKNGAVLITQKQCAAMLTRLKTTGSLGTPYDAIAWYKQWYQSRTSINSSL